ncbi:MAG: TIM-barrel domain-containing protein [Myxococcota bacterium]
MKRVQLLVFLLGMVSGCPDCNPPPDQVPPTTLQLPYGEYKLEFSDGNIHFRRANGESLLAFPTDAFQLGTVIELDNALSYDPYWLAVPDDPLNPAPPVDLVWETVKESSVTSQTESSLELMLAFTSGTKTRVTITAEADGRFKVDWVPTEMVGGVIAWMRIRPRADSTEGFYGLGEWTDDVNHRGKLRPMQIEVEAVESSYNENHFPIPLLIGTRGWGLFVQSKRLGVFDVARQDPVTVEVTYGTAEQSNEGLRFWLFGEDHPLDITQHYYDITGYPRLPAPWALGPLIWRDESRDQAEVEDDIRQIRDLDLATSGIWIDRPYASAVNTFDFDPAKFTDPQAMIDRAHAAGLRVSLWHTPYLENGAQPLRNEAESRGFFPPQSAVRLNGWSDPIDFTNPEAYAWWQDLIRRYTTMGIEGFKLDFAEDVVPSLYNSRNVWRFHDGSTERTMHYDYTRLYHRVYAETLPESGSFLLCRAGRWGDQVNVSVVWPGDMDATFTRRKEVFTSRDGEEIVGVGGLPATVIMGLTLGPSGFPFFGADTGGYLHSPPDKELFIRWAQQTALSSVMQVGDSSSQPPWVFTTENGRDQEALDIYRVYARLHMRLFPYEWTYAQQIAQTGRPITRSLGLAHPELGVHPNDIYLFGDDLLVAPVVTRGATSRSVTFSAGQWMDWWDGTFHEGNAEVAAPLSKLPLFVRAGAIIPMLRPTIDTIAPATDENVESYADDPGVLYVRLVLGTEGADFTLYDGTRITRTKMGGPAENVALHPGTTFNGAVVLELVPMDRPSRVLTDNSLPEVTDVESATEGWRYDEATRTLWVKVQPGDYPIITAEP